MIKKRVWIFKGSAGRYGEFFERVIAENESHAWGVLEDIPISEHGKFLLEKQNLSYKLVGYEWVWERE